MNRILSGAVLFSLVFLASSGLCAKIVYPWSATTAVVVSGSTFEVWFKADAGQKVNSITLKGPYNTADAVIDSTSTATWTYDVWSGNTCNQKIRVKVPANTPADKYDLVLNTSTGTVVSEKSVKVIKAYKSSFYIMHISDAHRWESTGDPIKTAREISTIIDVANVVDPEFLVETGDNIWGNNESASSWAERCNKMCNGFTSGTERFNGVLEAFAAVLITPGNHDCLTNNDYKEPSSQRPSADWNNNFGLQNFGIVYGEARILSVNVGWAIGSYAWQTDQLKGWLRTEGAGTFRIGMCHKPDNSITPFYSALRDNNTPMKLILAGHIHKTSENPISVDGKPIIYTANKNKYDAQKCPVNIYKIDLAAGTYAPMGNSTAGNYAISTVDDYSTKKVKTSFSKTNTGTNTDNVATISNTFTFPITGARIRFVMPKGNNYAVTGGTVKQAFDGTSYHIVDASFDINAGSTKTVSIAKSTTAVVNGGSISSKSGISFSGSKIIYSSSVPSMVSLSLYDMRGRLAGEVFNGTQQAGSHSLLLSGGLRAGVYVLKGRIGPESVSVQVVMRENR
jgi:hypothetical protein